MSRALEHAGIRQIVVDRFGSGAVTVLAADDDVVRGTLESDDQAFLDAVEVRQLHDQLRIALPPHWFRGPDAYLELRVPAGLDYQVTTGSADVRIEPAAARAKITSGSGTVSLAEVDEVSSTTGSGSILLGQVNADGARLTTGSGDIEIDRAGGEVQAKAASGDIRIRTLTAELRANSASGDISVPSTTASVDLRTASGDLQIGVAEGLPVWLDLSSVSGEIEIGLEADQAPAEGDPFVAVRARSASGDITVFRA